MKPIENFVNRFNASIHLEENLVVSRENRYFLVNTSLRRFVRKDFYYAGAYLGKVKDRIFFPSFLLLAMMAKGKANKTIVDDKAAWLFICGRDIFKRGILRVEGSKEKGSYTLVLNQRSECLGFGRLLHGIDATRGEDTVAVKNISDIGDFLRREK